MALGYKRANCELSLNTNSEIPQRKMEEVSTDQCSNRLESLESSQAAVPQDGHVQIHQDGHVQIHQDGHVQIHQDGHVQIHQDGHVQIMYCKDLVYEDGNEFSFEELRAQRYYKALSEKASHLNKLKQDLQLQIEQKRLQQKILTTPQQMVCEERVSDGSCSSDLKSNRVSSMGCQENMTDDGRDSKLQKMSTSKSFTVFDENSQSNKISSSSNCRSLKLPTLNLKAPRSKPEEVSISRSEEPIINGHWNKTLCNSPNDMCEFARAAQMASTPFAGADRQTPTEDLNTAAPEASQTQNTETRKLSPIQEISHDWGGLSLVTVPHENLKLSENADIILEEEEEPETAQTQDACSHNVRSRLLEQIDMTSFSNFHRQTGAFPEASGNDDLFLDGEMLFYRSKLKDYTLYTSSTGTVLLKVESSSVPWDFIISSKIQSSLSTGDDDDVHISCYLYENGCLTLWKVPNGITAEDLLAEPIARTDLSHLVIQLLEMVKRLHSCQIVHGGLKLETLYFHNSDITPLDFSASVDLQMQTNVRTVQDLSSAQDYITQGLLTPSASPYQVDLMGVAEIVHRLVLNQPLKVTLGNSGWILDEHHGSLDPVWKDFFQMILNPGELSTELILSSLISNLKE